jgi:hypothetical protein
VLDAWLGCQPSDVVVVVVVVVVVNQDGVIDVDEASSPVTTATEHGVWA